MMQSQLKSINGNQTKRSKMLLFIGGKLKESLLEPPP